MTNTEEKNTTQPLEETFEEEIIACTSTDEECLRVKGEMSDPAHIQEERDQVAKAQAASDAQHEGETPIIFLDDIKVTFKTRT